MEDLRGDKGIKKEKLLGLHSSIVERRSCKARVLGANPSVGSNIYALIAQWKSYSLLRSGLVVRVHLSVPKKQRRFNIWKMRIFKHM